MSHHTIDQISELEVQQRVLDQELGVLSREHDRAPWFLGERTKAVVSQQMSYLIRRREDCAQRLDQLRQQRDRERWAQNTRPQVRTGVSRRPAPSTTRPARTLGTLLEQQRLAHQAGMDRVQLQRAIDEAGEKIGELGRRIGALPYTRERKALIEERRRMIGERRRWIEQVNAA